MRFLFILKVTNLTFTEDNLRLLSTGGRDACVFQWRYVPKFPDVLPSPAADPDLRALTVKPLREERQLRRRAAVSRPPARSASRPARSCARSHRGRAPKDAAAGCGNAARRGDSAARRGARQASDRPAVVRVLLDAAGTLGFRARAADEPLRFAALLKAEVFVRNPRPALPNPTLLPPQTLSLPSPLERAPGAPPPRG